MALQLSWNKCEGDVWCGLTQVNLGHEHFNGMAGVYIIWHGGQNPHTVRVGQGEIRDRLEAHREDPDIQAYKELGLKVTWAKVAANQRDGVELYLAQALKPKVGARFPDVTPIECKLPW